MASLNNLESRPLKLLPTRTKSLRNSETRKTFPGSTWANIGVPGVSCPRVRILRHSRELISSGFCRIEKSQLPLFKKAQWGKAKTTGFRKCSFFGVHFITGLSCVSPEEKIYYLSLPSLIYTRRRQVLQQVNVLSFYKFVLSFYLQLYSCLKFSRKTLQLP